MANPAPSPNAGIPQERPVVFGSLDQMVVKRDPLSATISIVINVIIVAIIFYIAARKVGIIAPPKAEEITFVAPPPPPLKLPPKLATSGGGGGQKGPAPVSKGNPPQFKPEQLNPPKAPVVNAKLTPPVTVDVDPNIKMAKTNVPNFGMPNSPLVGTSLGNGNGAGIGSGNGNGIGAGTGGNMGGGLRRIGGSVSAPVILYQPEPEFSEEARKAKVAGNVLVYIEVDPSGHPTHVRILRGIGMGLDEKALEAVRQYKFKPAMENGHPVAVAMNIEVNFQIFRQTELFLSGSRNLSQRPAYQKPGLRSDAMFCPRCGKQSPDEANFCASCGAQALPAPGAYPAQPRIVRPRSPRMVAGVCTGLAIHFGWDVALLRILFVVGTVFTGGLGLVAYVAAWLLLPDAPYALPPVRSYSPAPPSPPEYPTQTF